MKQLPLPIALPASDGFDTVLAGANAQALAHLQALVPGAAAGPPVYLWGPEGSGKTRLLQALAKAHAAAGVPVAWFDSVAPLPWAWPEGGQLLVLDQADQLDAARQQAAFALFVEATSQAVAWVAAGRCPPIDLPLRDDLRSRLGWGHVFALQPLADGQAQQALQREAARRGISLSAEVVGYLLTRFERNLGPLMALLDRLDAFALAEQRAVTVPLLKKMLAETAETAETMPSPQPPPQPPPQIARPTEAQAGGQPQPANQPRP